MLSVGLVGPAATVVLSEVPLLYAMESVKAWAAMSPTGLK